MTRRFLSFLVFAGLLATLRAADYRPEDYGAVANGTTLVTTALQQALDAAHAAGGGTVHLGPGTYLTGSLVLRSGVTLHLAREAVLLGSPRLADYRRGQKWPALLIAVEQQDIAVTGEGVIDGQGRLVAADTVRIFESGNLVDFFPGVAPGQTVNLGGDIDAARLIDPHALHATGELAAIVAPRPRTDLLTWRVDEIVRPQLIEFSYCQRVRVEGITLRHAANWVQSYRMCVDLTLTGLRVDSTTYWNNDGMDIVNCRRVRIADCDINSADDGICLKSELNAAGLGCEDVVIERCRLRTSASAVKFGTASHHAFRRIMLRDLEVRDTYRTAVALETVDGAVLEDITVQRVRVRHSGGAFFLRLGHRNAAKPPGILRNILLEDFDVEIAPGKADAGYPHEGPPSRVAHNPLPAVIAGLPGYPVENVTIRNVRITYPGGATRDRAEVPVSALDRIPENRAGYPEYNMFGELPAWGFFIRDARDLRLDQVSFRLRTPDFRSALVAHRVSELSGHNLAFGELGGTPVAVLVDSPAARLESVTWPTGTDPAARRLDLRQPAR